ncbi:MAG: EVE domain-containing protein [Patescibacteria group bacterium]
MNYWLMKSEEDEYSIDMLKKDKRAPWFGVRNFQARNFMRDDMKIGDKVLFYHSNANPSAVVGLAKVASDPHTDKTALDKKSKYSDVRSTKEKPIWECVDVEFVSKLNNVVTLEYIKGDAELSNMLVAKRGQRLSIQPVEKSHFDRIIELGTGK